jgi:hypothetical protein
VKRENTRYVYRQGHAMMVYISGAYGREKRNEWLRKLAAGATLDEASRAVLGKGFAAVDAAWREGLRAVKKAAPDADGQGEK